MTCEFVLSLVNKAHTHSNTNTMDALRASLIQTGLFREDEEGNLQNITAAQLASKTNAEKLAMMMAMYSACTAVGKFDAVSEAEHADQLKTAQATIGKLAVKALNDEMQASNERAGKALKSKKQSVAKGPYEKPSGR